MKYRISHHALEEMLRREISGDLVERVLSHPEQIVPAWGGRSAFQSRFDFGGGKIYLVRVIVDHRTAPPVVVTVYRTTKVEKYWRMT